MALSEEARKARNKYMREWKKKNPDKVRRYNERMWEKKAKQLEEQKKEQ